ncbi:MAG: hypothetical protein IIW32_07010 [Bacteroides sp.]|nr:hypothetical protein [Bacteroides sp.]
MVFAVAILRVRKWWLPLFGSGGGRRSETLVVDVRKWWCAYAMRTICSWHKEVSLMA